MYWFEMGIRFCRGCWCFGRKATEEVGAGLPEIKKNALFASGDISHDITPLLKTDSAATRITDSSEADFEQEMVSTIIKERRNTDDEP
jgi:hypothetical protein